MAFITKERADAFKLMRIPFSVFLMPVFWFALSRHPTTDIIRAIGIFVVLHLLVYPASNGYNSYYDRDTTSIGGLKHPPLVTSSLYHLILIFDLLSIACAVAISPIFAVLIFIYMLVSKAYSYDKIRLKKYPFISTITVSFFQGAFVYMSVIIGIGVPIDQLLTGTNLLYALVSSLFLLGSYPLTQVYQHQADSIRGDITLSILLGIKGTFVFAAIAFGLASILIAVLFYYSNEPLSILIYFLTTAPIGYYFLNWAKKVFNNPHESNFDNTMQMNKVSSIAISSAFILILIFRTFN